MNVEEICDPCPVRVPPMYCGGNLPARPSRPPWNMAPQMLMTTTEARTRMKKAPCQLSVSSMRVMASVKMKSTMIRARLINNRGWVLV